MDTEDSDTTFSNSTFENKSANPFLAELTFRPFDEQLETHFKKLLPQTRTILLILSLIGNETNETPFFYIVFPKKIWKFLTDKEKLALMTNQDRLITTKDIHGLLKRFLPLRGAEELNNGMMAPIEQKRFCTDVTKHSQDTLSADTCICEKQ